MGKKLKRVDLSFKWPLNKVWDGYINEYANLQEKCAKCDGTGNSEYAEELYQKWHDFEGETEPSSKGGVRFKNAIQYNLNEEDIAELIGQERLWNFTRVPINEEQKQIVKDKVANGENSLLPFNNGYVPSPDEVNQWAKLGFGHDSINCWIVIRSRCEKAGESCACDQCGGHGFIWSSEEDKNNYENWVEIEPPVGDGFQLWETTSEGSPVSPVFKSLEELCEYCENNCYTFARAKASKEKWMEMLEKDDVHHTQGKITFI